MEASAPKNLLKFVDFLSEKAVNANAVGMKTGTHIHSTKLPESIKNAISLMSCNTNTSKNFPGTIPISRDHLLLSLTDVLKMDRFPTI